MRTYILALLVGVFAWSANATLITLDETNNTFNFAAGSGVIAGNVWLCEPGGALTAGGCTVSDLAHFFNQGGVDKVIFISDQDPTPPPTIDQPADQLGFGGNVPAAGDVFLREAYFSWFSFEAGAWYSPITGIGSGTDPANGSMLSYKFISDCSDGACEVMPEPSTLLPMGFGLLVSAGLLRRFAVRRG